MSLDPEFFKWYEKTAKAANGGDIESAYNLGTSIIHSVNSTATHGSARDGEEYLLMAANKGHKDAQFELGKLYKTGLKQIDYGPGPSVYADAVKAVHWYTLSAKQGHVNALVHLIRFKPDFDDSNVLKYFTDFADKTVKKLLGYTKKEISKFEDITRDDIKILEKLTVSGCGRSFFNEQDLVTIKRFSEQSRDFKRPFLMPIADVVSIPGRGLVVTGNIERGCIKIGDTIDLVGFKQTQEVTIREIESSRKKLVQAQNNKCVGILLERKDGEDLSQKDVHRGMILAHSKSVFAHQEFIADMYFYKTSEGGSDKPIKTGERLQFYFNTTDVTGTIEAIFENREVMYNEKIPVKKTAALGEKTLVRVKLIHPVPMQKGFIISVRGGKYASAWGNGVIREILDYKGFSYFPDHSDQITKGLGTLDEMYNELYFKNFYGEEEMTKIYSHKYYDYFGLPEPPPSTIGRGFKGNLE